jgi:hypothetical protein
VDPALFSDFFPKSESSSFDFSNLSHPDSSCVGLVDRLVRGESLDLESADSSPKDKPKPETKAEKPKLDPKKPEEKPKQEEKSKPQKDQGKKK